MRSSTMLWVTRVLLVLFCLTGSTVMLAQSTGGRVVGRVADPSDAVLANVTVRLINEATGGVRETKTNASGDYSLLEVSPGSYTVVVRGAGSSTGIAVVEAYTLE